MQDAFVTFIIPSLAKESLPKTLDSLRRQTDQRWKAIVCFDHRDPTIEPEEKISVFRHEGYSKKEEDCVYCIEGKKSGAGPVRNECIKKATTEWVAFLDDDDVVTNDYVEKLAMESKDADLVIFRMMMWGGLWIPRQKATVENLKHGSVGISFAAKKNVFEKCQFSRGRGEDFRMIINARDQGFKVKLSNFLTYLVRQRETSERALSTKKEAEEKLSR
jgi:glycosyltransferase involved in cell wall biosynthesis